MTAPPPPAAIPPTGPGEARRLTALAWPVIVGQLGVVAMGTVDVAMVGALSGDALAAVGVGHIWSFGVLIAGFGVVGGLDPLFSQTWGAGDRTGGARVLARALWMATWLSVPLTLLHLVAGPALAALGQPAEVLPQAAAYASAVAPGVLPAMLFQALSRYLQGRGEMKLPMLAVLVGNAVNIVGNGLLVFGFSIPGLVEVPALGALGCGIATSAVRFAMIVALCWLSRDLLRSLPWPSLRATLSPRAQRRLLAVSGPVGLQYGLEVWAFSATGLLMGMLGSLPVAGHAVAMNLISITFMVPFGLGAAAATRIGNLIGAGHAWGRAAWTSVGLGVAWMGCSSAVLALFPSALAQLYTREVEVVAMAALLLPIAAAFQLFDGIQAVTFGVLRGAGDTRMPALANLIGYWILGLPTAWWLGVRAGPAPRWVWGGLVIGLVVVATLLLLRLTWLLRRPVARLPVEDGA